MASAVQQGGVRGVCNASDAGDGRALARRGSVERRDVRDRARRAGRRATPDREALTDGTRRLTYRELADGIDRMAARLRALGIGAGRRGDDPAAELGRVCVRVLRARAPGRGGGDGQRRFPQPRARIHHALRRSKMFVCCARFRDFDHLAMAAELQPRLPGARAASVVVGGRPRAPAWSSLDERSPRRGARRRASSRRRWTPTR